jgi:hypothetical protein
LVAERERQDRLADEQEEEERAGIEARVAAMSDFELRDFAEDKKTPLTDRAIAVAEGKRRDLTFGPPSKKKRLRSRREPPPGRAPAHQGADDRVERGDRIMFSAPRVIADPYADAGMSDEEDSNDA